MAPELEPSAEDLRGTHGQGHALFSAAISLKRIADTLAKFLAHLEEAKQKEEDRENAKGK